MVVVSNSELTAYRKCPMRWAVQYHLGLRPPDKPGSATSVGTATHQMIEHKLTTGMSGLDIATANDTSDLLTWGAASQFYRIWEQRLYDTAHNPFVHGIRCEQRFRRALVSAHDELKHIEAVQCVVDVCGPEDDPRALLVDHKTTSGSVASWRQRYGLQTRWQMLFYDLCLPPTDATQKVEVHVVSKMDEDVGILRWSITPEKRAHAQMAIMHTLVKMDSDMRLVDNDFTAWEMLMAPGEQCQYCPCRSICTQKMASGTGDVRQMAEQESWQHVDRLAHHEKANA